MLVELLQMQRSWVVQIDRVQNLPLWNKVSLEACVTALFTPLQVSKTITALDETACCAALCSNFLSSGKNAHNMVLQERCLVHWSRAVHHPPEEGRQGSRHRPQPGELPLPRQQPWCAASCARKDRMLCLHFARQHPYRSLDCKYQQQHVSGTRYQHEATGAVGFPAALSFAATRNTTACDVSVHHSHAGALELITRKGFDIRRANIHGLLGAGIYFAQHVTYSLRFAPRPKVRLALRLQFLLLPSLAAI